MLAQPTGVLEIFWQLQIQSQIHVRTSLIAPVGEQHINSSEIVMRQHQIAANWRDGSFFIYLTKMASRRRVGFWLKVHS